MDMEFVGFNNHELIQLFQCFPRQHTVHEFIKTHLHE